MWFPPDRTFVVDWASLKINYLIYPWLNLCSRDMSVGRERNPIACVNAFDDEPHPTDYLYVNHNVETQDLHINNVITSLQVRTLYARYTHCLLGQGVPQRS